jgi:hypothetical protein
MKREEKKEKRRRERMKPEIVDLSSSGASFTNKLEEIAFPTISFFSRRFPNAANPDSLIFESPLLHDKIKQKVTTQSGKRKRKVKD